MTAMRQWREGLLITTLACPFGALPSRPILRPDPAYIR
jgi:hypothetical protein